DSPAVTAAPRPAPSRPRAQTLPPGLICPGQQKTPGPMRDRGSSSYCSVVTRRRSGVAGQLLPQRGQLGVAGERAAGGLGLAGGRLRAALGGVVAAAAVGRLGLGVGRHLLHLSGVHLVATLGLGVARLPLVPLLLVALEPFGGLGVEADRKS